jgi:hypothetical protein
MFEPCQFAGEPLQEEPNYYLGGTSHFHQNFPNHAIVLEHFPSNHDPHARFLHPYLDMKS